MSVQYTGGCSVDWGVSLSTPGVFSTLGDIMSTPGGVFSTVGDTMSVAGYHEYIRGCSVHYGFHTIQLLSQ